MAKMASGKTVKTLLSFVVTLFLVVCVLEVQEAQGTSRRNRNQRQNQTQIMELLKKLQARYGTNENIGIMKSTDGRMPATFVWKICLLAPSQIKCSNSFPKNQEK